MFKRTRYQFGWLRKKSRKRGPDVWVWGLSVNYTSREAEGKLGDCGKRAAVSLRSRCLEGR